MRLRTHILTSALLGAALYPRAPRKAGLLLAGGVLLDADHYLIYALRSGNWNPLSALRCAADNRMQQREHARDQPGHKCRASLEHDQVRVAQEASVVNRHRAAQASTFIAAASPRPAP
jgi:hypothetical protein